LVHMVRVLLGVVATAVAFAAPAAADQDDYLRPLQERFVFLSAQQLLSEGTKVCNAIRSGKTSTDAVIMVRNDLGVSVATAGEIVSGAVVDLGC
jgi:hypothetical protein